MSSATPTESAGLEESSGVDAAGATGTDRDAPASSEVEGPAQRRFAGRLPIEVVVLFVLSVVTRFTSIYTPRVISFDEVYFRAYALSYKTGSYYFDLHPPLGKLLLGAWGAVAGVDATATSSDPAVALRLFPAAMGTLLILVFYFLLRQLSGSRRVATLGAGLLMLDNALLAESRFTLMDTMLLLFGMTAVLLMVRAREHSGRRYWALLTGAIVFAGMAGSIKLTGLTAFGLIGLVWLVDVIRERRSWRSVLGQVVLFVTLPLAIYIGSFAVPLALLPNTGPGDGYMSQQFQSTLKGNALYKPDAEMSFWEKFKDINGVISRGQEQLKDDTHPDASKWYTWPLDRTSVYIAYAEADNGKGRYVYAIGNPFVWWGTILGALVVVGGWIARRAKFQPYRWELGLLAVGWAANWFPFAFIVRPMFLYHYFFALMFSLAFVVFGLGILAGWIEKEDKARPLSFGGRRSALGYWGILAAALLVFLYFGPITFATPISPEGLDDRLWLSTWR